MAHHQRHGGLPVTALSQSLDSRPASSTMPLINEDDLAAESDEPPERSHQEFSKTAPSTMVRRESLLTKALYTDSESHDDDPNHHEDFRRQTSRSSTCSSVSNKCDITSDDGLASNGTRASTPSSPPQQPLFSKVDYAAPTPIPKLQVSHPPPESSDHKPEMNASSKKTSPPENNVEAGLGRKRCITFACGKNRPTSSRSEKAPDEKHAEPPKRPCSIRFACPSKLFTKAKEEPAMPTRHMSPPPPSRAKSPPTDTPIRKHRDSDSTVKNESPRAIRKPSVNQAHISNIRPETEPSEATDFHEFGCTDKKLEGWVEESTCHKQPLTVADTLKKENDIRRIGEEAEEEALEEEEEEDQRLDEDDSDDDVSDAGFQTDDEDGFAESDDDSDDGSNYEWWAPRKSHQQTPTTLVPDESMRPRHYRKSSDSSIDSAMEGRRPSASQLKGKVTRRRSQAVPIRPRSPEMPDSTDFVCGTLDEDRPLEDAYASCIEQRKMAKHRAVPQDIDPTFPASDPEAVSDEEEDEVDAEEPNIDERVAFLQGPLENLHGEEQRGRKPTVGYKPSPKPSPRRLKSPPPMKRVKSPAPVKRTKSPAPVKRAKSPPPTKRILSPCPPKSKPSPAPTRKKAAPPPLKRGNSEQSQTPTLFNHSRTRKYVPIPVSKLTSPPPSRRGSFEGVKPMHMPFGTTFLGARPTLTHTSSLPRSPHPFGRKQVPFAAAERSPPPDSASNSEDEDDSSNDTARENNVKYKRGAIDIVQGLETKRLKRRQKFYEKYHRQQEKKYQKGEYNKHTQPGKGAQRMRQVGIECAMYKGKRVLSI